MKYLGIYIKLLRQCNLRCTYCYEQEHFNDPRIMTLAEIRFILEKVREYSRKAGVKKIGLYFTGGEVMLLGEKYLSELFRLSARTFRGSGVKIWINIQSNITLLTPGIIRQLKKYKISVGASFDVYGGQRKLKDGRVADPLIIEKLIMLLKAGIDFCGLTVITRANYKKGAEIFKIFNQMNRDFHTNLLQPNSAKYCPQLVIKPAEYARTLRDIIDTKAGQANCRIGVSSADPYTTLLKEGPGAESLCVFSKHCLGENLFIQNDGRVYPCDNLREKPFYLGNIFKDEIAGMLKSKVMSIPRIRDRRLSKECQGCEYHSICNGGCLSFAFYEGNILGKSKTYCAINKCMFNYAKKRTLSPARQN